MENKIDKLESKLEVLDEKLDDIVLTLVTNTKSLDEHMRRTAILEDYVTAEMKPLKSRMDAIFYGVKGVMWVAGILAGLAGFIFLLSQMGFFNLPK